MSTQLAMTQNELDEALGALDQARVTIATLTAKLDRMREVLLEARNIIIYYREDSEYDEVLAEIDAAIAASASAPKQKDLTIPTASGIIQGRSKKP